MKHVLSLAAVILLASPAQANPLKTVAKFAVKAAQEAESVAKKSAKAAKAAAETAGDLSKAELAVAKANALLQYEFFLLAKEDFHAKLAQ
jgi:hypothetical protein